MHYWPPEFWRPVLKLLQGSLRKNTTSGWQHAANHAYIQDFSAEALPQCVDPRDAHIHGANKYCQIGPEASLSWMKGCITGADLTNVKGLLLLNLWANVGELEEAFIKLRSSLTCSTFLLSFASNQVEKEFLSCSLLEFVADLLLNDKLVMPNGAKLAKEVPNDLLDPLPQLPKLNVLVTVNEKEADSETTLQLPIAIVKQWANHPEFGKQFTSWLDKFSEKYTVIDPSQAAPEPKPGEKRPGQGHEGTPPPKKAKSLPSTLVCTLASINKVMLSEAKIQSKDSFPAFVQIRAGPSAHFANCQASSKNHL